MCDAPSSAGEPEASHTSPRSPLSLVSNDDCGDEPYAGPSHFVLDLIDEEIQQQQLDTYQAGRLRRVALLTTIAHTESVAAAKSVKAKLPADATDPEVRRFERLRQLKAQLAALDGLAAAMQSAAIAGAAKKNTRSPQPADESESGTRRVGTQTEPQSNKGDGGGNNSNGRHRTQPCQSTPGHVNVTVNAEAKTNNKGQKSKGSTPQDTRQRTAKRHALPEPEHRNQVKDRREISSSPGSSSLSDASWWSDSSSVRVESFESD